MASETARAPLDGEKGFDSIAFCRKPPASS
jgi:hypothetical protein